MVFRKIVMSKKRDCTFWLQKTQQTWPEWNTAYLRVGVELQKFRRSQRLIFHAGRKSRLYLKAYIQTYTLMSRPSLGKLIDVFFFFFLFCFVLFVCLFVFVCFVFGEKFFSEEGVIQWEDTNGDYRQTVRIRKMFANFPGKIQILKKNTQNKTKRQ